MTSGLAIPAGTDLFSYTTFPILRPLAGGFTADARAWKLWALDVLSLKEKARCLSTSGLTITAGSDLLSHTVSHAVPSAVAGLTSVFGMGTGVTLII